MFQKIKYYSEDLILNLLNQTLDIELAIDYVFNCWGFRGDQYCNIAKLLVNRFESKKSLLKSVCISKAIRKCSASMQLKWLERAEDLWYFVENEFI